MKQNIDFKEIERIYQLDAKNKETAEWSDFDIRFKYTCEVSFKQKNGNWCFCGHGVPSVNKITTRAYIKTIKENTYLYLEDSNNEIDRYRLTEEYLKELNL